MKRTMLLWVMILAACSAFAKLTVDRIDPPFWYVGMSNGELQLMAYGENVGNASVKVDYHGVKVDRAEKLDSDNYLFVYLSLSKDAEPGNVQLSFSVGDTKIERSYQLRAREKAGNERIGFDASDALYLLMPDRFANGNPENDFVESMSDYKVDRDIPDARHGGDLAGIARHIDYFADLGVTALWFTPVLENNIEGGSYHGYATTDYYRIDPRFGTNEEYKALVGLAHSRGIKIVMDMIFNHCGIGHPWVTDAPSRDWFNNPDHENKFVQTSFKLSPHVDPYASGYDFAKMNDGWFVREMPDLNQRNPHVLRYLVQNSFWWIEYAGIDGIRMDTYPYADYDAMSLWMQELNEEYPNFNTVGETWTIDPAYTAWWQKDSRLSAPRNSHLKTVMDFSFFDKLSYAKNEQTDGHLGGLNRIYNSFVYDFLYPNPASVLAFLENHDTDRFLASGDNLHLLKQATILLLTTRRIPQLYYGTEVMMNGVRTANDGYVRCDFPGGWQGDTVDAFVGKGLSEKQRECYEFYKKILHWRKGNEVVANGNMTQFVVQNGVYAYARCYEGHSVLVLLNGTDCQTTIDLANYSEILGAKTKAVDVISGRVVSLVDAMTMQPRESIVLEL